MYSLRTQLSPGRNGGRFETLLSEYKIFLKHFFHSCVLSSLTSTMTKTCKGKVTLSLPRQCIDLITSVFILQQCAPGYTRLYPGPDFSPCVPCSCNGHSKECHPENGHAWWVCIFALFVNNPQIALKKEIMLKSHQNVQTHPNRREKKSNITFFVSKTGI